MTSDAQIAANQRNCTKSTGPRTAAGKAAASRNALRHGMTARQVVVFDESEEAFMEFLAAQRAAWEPADEAEEGMVERIAACAWRLRRAIRAEAAIFNNKADDLRPRRPHDVDASLPFVGGTGAIAMVTRYEASVERTLRRAEGALERKQRRRRDAADGAKNENCETKPIFDGVG